MKAGVVWTRERELSSAQGFVLGYLVQNPGASAERAEATLEGAAA